jgi:putative signal transducing protein
MQVSAFLEPWEQRTLSILSPLNRILTQRCPQTPFPMKQIFSSPDSAEVGLLASRLQSVGIDCEIRNETQVIPGLPFQPELWIVSDADYEDASKLIGTWENPEAAAGNGSTTLEVEPPALEEFALLDTIIATLYRAISGPAGPRDWERFRELFYPGARLLRTLVSPEGAVSMSAMDVQGFIDFADPFLRRHPFYERELVRQLDQFGQIAQLFSTFESSPDPESGSSLGRGINSLQLWFDGRRWWIMNMLWDDERPGNPIPSEYLA